MSIRSALRDLKRLVADGEPITGSALQALIGTSIFVIVLVPFLALVGQGLPEFRIFVKNTPAQVATFEMKPVLVVSADRAGMSLASAGLSVEPIPAPKVPELIEHPVQDGDTLIDILKAYCRSDYEAVARDNKVDPHRIYANKTVLKFKNGCAHAPSVLVKQSVSPRELVSNGGASSGKHISRTEATRASNTASAPTLSVSQPQSRPLPTTIVVLPSASDRVTTSPVSQLVVNDVRPLSVIYHRDIYRIADLRKMQIAKVSTPAGLAEMNRLQTEIRKATLARYPLKNADCLYDTKLPTIDRLGCIRENYGETIAENLKRHPTVGALTQSYVEAVILVESGGRPDAISETGCTGVKQFTLASAKKFNLADRLDPYEGIRAGVDHLADNLRMWGNNVAKATAHYNVGSVEVSKKGFDAHAFPYTRSVLFAKRLIDNGSERSTGSQPLIAPKVISLTPPLPGFSQALQLAGREYPRMTKGQSKGKIIVLH